LRRRKNSGPALAGQAPAPTTDGSQWVTGQRPAGSPMYTKGSRRKTGSILAPPKSAARRRASSTASNLDTHSTEGTVEVRMLLSFQRPPHLQREGESLSRGTPGVRLPDSGADDPIYHVDRGLPQALRAPRLRFGSLGQKPPAAPELRPRRLA
jgi:hypothetical protein